MIRLVPGLVMMLMVLACDASAAVPWLKGVEVDVSRVPATVFDTEAVIYRAGPEHAPPVVLVHGLGAEGARFWRELIPALAADHRVIAMDLPGFGNSGKPNVVYSPENYADFLNELIRAETDQPVTLVGHSMGAAVALYYASQHAKRVDRMVLASTAGILQGTAYAHFLSRMGVQQFLPEVPGIGDAAGKLVQRLLTKFNRLGPDPETALKTAESRELYLEADPNRIAALALVSTNYTRIIRETRVPTLLLWGAADQVAPVRVGYLLTALMPNARLKAIDGGDHMFPVEMAERFNRLVGNALALSPRAFRDYAQDAYPRPFPASPPETERTGECRGERGRVFSGRYSRLLIYDCDEVEIRDAHIGRLEILGSEVSIRNSRVDSADVAVVLANSSVEMTAVRIHGTVGVDATGSRVDAAGVEIVAEKYAIRAPAPSVFTFSVSRVHSPRTDTYLHQVVEVTSRNPL